MFKMRHSTTCPRPFEGTQMAACTFMEHTGLPSLPSMPSSVPQVWHGGGKIPLGKREKPADLSPDPGNGYLVQAIADGGGGQDVQNLLEFGVLRGQAGGCLRFVVSG